MALLENLQNYLGIKFGDQAYGRENSDDTLAIGYGDPHDNEDPTGATEIHGLSGDDTISMVGMTGSWEQVFVDGGDDYDTLVLQLQIYASSMDIDLSGGVNSLAGITWSNIERLLVFLADGDDTFRGGELNETVNAGDGFNVLRGGGGADSLTGGSNRDELYGGIGDDGLFGNGGNDSLDGGTGINTIWGGAGVDTLDYSGTGFVLQMKVEVNLALGTGVFDGSNQDSLDGIENVVGTIYNDKITGDDEANELTGLDGRDLLVGGKGDDTLRGGLLDDELFGQENNDILFGDEGIDRLNGGFGLDELYGGPGNDYFEGGPGFDIIDGGADLDTVIYTTSPIAVFVNLTTETTRFAGYTDPTEVETLIGIEAVIGSPQDDSLTGDAKHNRLYGGAGDDRIFAVANGDVLEALSGDFLYGEGGEDQLTGDTDGDYLNGGADNDILTGDDGDDTLLGEDGNDTLNGGNGADQLDGGAGNDLLITGRFDKPGLLSLPPMLDGGLGTDTVDFSGIDVKVLLRLGETAPADRLFVGNDTAQALSAPVISVENAIGGTGNDVLSDSAVDNVLDGGAGNDWIISQNGGRDTLKGGSGDDELSVGGVVDEILDGGAGLDTLSYVASTVIANFSATATSIEKIKGLGFAFQGGPGVNVFNFSGLTELVEVPLVSLGGGNDTFVGSQFAETVLAGAGLDTVSTGAGADIIRIAGGEAQDDVMNGGAGTDTIQALGSGAVILAGFLPTNLIEQWQGNSSGLYGTTVNNILDLSLLTAVTGLSWIDGLAGNDTITGTGFNDRLIGNTGLDTLNGGGGNDTLEGGADKDTLNGGAGDDTYVLAADTTDVVVDASGIDTIRSSVARNLGAYATIENLLLEGSGHLNSTGNALTNKLTGNSGNNILNGMAGLDTLIGGHGNDTYVINRAVDGGITDVIQEAGTTSSAADVVQFTGNAHGQGYALGANLENLILLGNFTTNGAGNALANTITGNSGANVLDGKAGLDTLTGGHGNDVYVVNLVVEGTTRADTIQETGTVSSAADLVQFTGSANSQGFVLGANLENLTLLGALSTNGTGNGLANTLTGNAASNTLKGGAANDLLIGGAGSDLLFGEGDNDTFRFLAVGDSVVGAARDAIQDFDLSGNDVIDLSLMAGVGSFIGGAAFSAAGQVRVVAVTGGVLVQINTVGIGGAESEIFIAGATTTAGPRQVDASDFLL